MISLNDPDPDVLFSSLAEKNAWKSWDRNSKVDKERSPRRPSVSHTSSYDHNLRDDTATMSMRPGNKSKSGPLPPTPMHQDDRQIRPPSREMPAMNVPSGQMNSQGYMTGRHPEDRDPGNREPEQRQDRRPEQRQLRDSLRERDGESRRGHGGGGGGMSLLSGLTKFGRSVSSWGTHPEDQYAEPDSHYDDRGGYDNLSRHDRGSRRQNSGTADEVRRLRQLVDEQYAKLSLCIPLLNKKKITTSKVKLSADKMQLVMDNKDLFVGVQQNDDVILTKFRNLFGQISTWSKKFSKNDNADLERLDQQTKMEFERVAPGCLTQGPPGQEQPSLWDSAKRIRMLIQGWVGLVMTEKLFRTLSGTSVPIMTAQDLWMGFYIDQNVGSLEYKLAGADRTKVALRELHDWRSLTIELLSRVDFGTKAEQEKDSSLAAMTKRIVDVAGMWAPPDAIPGLHERLLGILTEAMAFSQLLRRQRACWSIRGPPPPPPSLPARNGAQPTASCQNIPFNRLFMKDQDELEDDYGDDQGGPPKSVEVFIMPGLFKRGDADGEHFETNSCIAEIQVLCIVPGAFAIPARA